MVTGVAIKNKNTFFDVRVLHPHAHLTALPHQIWLLTLQRTLHYWCMEWGKLQPHSISAWRTGCLPNGTRLTAKPLDGYDAACPFLSYAHPFNASEARSSKSLCPSLYSLVHSLHVGSELWPRSQPVVADDKHHYITCIIIIIGTVSAKIAPRLKCYKNASRLNRYNFPTDNAIDFLFSPLHSEMV